MSQTLSLPELNAALTKGREELKSKYESYPLKTLPDGTQARDIPANDVTELKKRNDELGELAEKRDVLERAEAEIKGLEEDRRPVNRLGETKEKNDNRSLSERVMASPQYKNKSGAKFSDVALDVELKDLFGLELKTTMTTSAGFGPFVSRDGNVVPAISRPPQLLDLLRIERTNQNAVKFMKQTTRTNNAAAKAENSALDEAAIAYTEATVDIRKIGVYIPVTEEQLEDEDGVRSLIDNDLILMVRQKADELVTVGDGVAPNIRGIYNATSIQSQARGADPVFDTVMKAATKVRVTGRATPNAVVMHSTDFQSLVLTRTADGIYILGNPGDAPVLRVWGLNAIMSEALTVGTGLVLDTNYFRLKVRKDVEIAVSDSHGELFIQNVLAIRAHMRLGLQILRDEAASRMTGL